MKTLVVNSKGIPVGVFNDIDQILTEMPTFALSSVDEPLTPPRVIGSYSSSFYKVVFKWKETCVTKNFRRAFGHYLKVIEGDQHLTSLDPRLFTPLALTDLVSNTYGDLKEW